MSQKQPSPSSFVRLFSHQIIIGALLGILGGIILLAAPADNHATAEPLLTVRAKDQVTLHVRSAYLTFNETLVVTPAAVKSDRTQPGATSLVHFLIAPFWLKDGNYRGPAFPVLRPQLTLTSGRLKRFVLLRPDGESVRTVDEITPDCRYVLTLEFGHMLPEQFTVTVQMSSPVGVSSDAELSYTPSNDGHTLGSGTPESVQTAVHIVADENLEPWRAMRGNEMIPRHDAWVTLDREVPYTIRFAPKGE